MYRPLCYSSPHRVALFFGVVLLLGGCRPPSEAEQAFSRFRSHLEKQQTARAWAMLTQRSQQALQQALRRANSQESPAQFFQKASFLRNLRMRPHPARPPHQTQTLADLHFLDELGRSQVVRLRREDNRWCVDLRGTWVLEEAAPTSRPVPTTSPTSQTAQTRPSSR